MKIEKQSPVKKNVILLAVIFAMAVPAVSHAQLGGLGNMAKNKAVEKLTDETMKSLEKKFTELVVKENIPPAVKDNVVKSLSEIARPIVARSLDSVTSGKLPNVTELSTAVLNEILPRIPTLIESAIVEGGGNMTVTSTTVQTSTGQTSTATTASATLPSTGNYDPEKDFTAIAIDNGNSARITKYNGKNTEVKIPPRIENRLVTEIGEQAFIRKGLTSVAIPDSVIFIGNMAFAGNPIGSVSIGANVYIADNAFENAGYNTFSSGFYNSQGRRAGNYTNSWRLASVAPSVGTQTSTATASGGTQASNTQTKGTSVKTPPETAEIFAGNGHKYEVINTSKSWTNAKKDCEEHGGYLVTVTSIEEQEFIEDLLKKNGKLPNYWLGGYAEKKKWQWVTGEPFDYTNWMPSEPSYGGEDKLMLSRVKRDKGTSYQWNDMINNGQKGDWGKIGYICEYDN